MAIIWSKIKSMNKKSQGKGFTWIQIPAPWPADEESFKDPESIENPKIATEWKTIDVPKDIEFYLLMCNRLHFGQAKGTLLTVPTLSVQVDWTVNL
eukprot:116114-Ditylum_brightwellii.AAC.1